MDSPMLNVRQKEITDRIKSTGFKLKEFHFKATNNHFFELVFIGTDFRFKTSMKGLFMSPGLDGGSTITANPGSWEPNLVKLEKWLSIIMLEKEIGNPWEEDEDNFYFYSEINEGHEDGEASFTETEIKNISICLAEIKQYLLSNTALTQQQLNTIQSDIKRLEANSNKVSKKDWFFLLIGLLFSWVLGGILPPDQPKILFDRLSEFVANGVKTVFKILE